MRERKISDRAIAAVWAASLIAATPAMATESPDGARLGVSPATFAAVGRVNQRFQSYNVESVEVTGGNFWAPYLKAGEPPPQPVAGPHGVEFASGAYRKREPIDLKGNARLRRLAKALGPAYVRVSGSWANSIYFQDDDQPALAKAPPGYQGVLTRAQWAGLVDFAKAVDAKILTSFATSQGARDADGRWNPDGARRLFAYTHKLGGRIDAVELTNEPNVGRPPYNPVNFARDQAALRDLVKTVSPDTTIVGPGSTGEAGFKLFAAPPKEISTATLLSGDPQPRFDVFSYHFYGAVSQRCASLREGATTSTDEALSEAWLARADQAQAHYAAMRDRFAPGAPIWITETAQTACGGDPWSATFLDTFRYVDQLGRFAKHDVAVVFHNTLAASDYALIDDTTWRPRPSYWAALLWRRLMGEMVLDAGVTRSDLHVYAHCLRDHSGGVALVAINLSPTARADLKLPLPAERYTLTADALESGSVKLNGRALSLTRTDKLPPLTGARVPPGALSLEPTSITFLSIPQARNPACR
jgi:heparanase 1